MAEIIQFPKQGTPFIVGPRLLSMFVMSTALWGMIFLPFWFW